jgi:hypothetical protein
MELAFEVVQELGIGSFPDVMQFYDTQAQLFAVADGRLEGSPINEVDTGHWELAELEDAVLISPDENMLHFEIGVLSGFGAIGGYKTNNKHKMLIYEFAIEMDRYLNSGSIKHSINSSISSFTLTMENPLDENPEHEGNVAMSEESSFLSPGSKIVFAFSMGDSDPYEMGAFYVDRSNFTLLNETVTVDGRNLIGKALNDQTFDEGNEYPFGALHLILKDILLRANISPYNLLVETTSVQAGYRFDPKMTYLNGILEVFKALDNWKIDELVDGTVVIGSNSYAGFVQNSTYVFKRDKDIFSRSIVRDDQEAYRRVCVHTSDYSVKVYRDVETYTGWNLQGNKTLYVNVPEGTSITDAEVYADQIANNLENVGKVESFTGPFRPQILIGDEAVIVSSGGAVSLGLITEITHKFGKEGFYTDFTVDSGGILGKGRLGDYISRITKDKTSSSRVYE